VEEWLHTFLTSTLDVLEWSASRSNRFNPGEGPLYSSYMRLGGLQCRSGTLGEDKISIPCPCRKWNLGCPASSL